MNIFKLKEITLENKFQNISKIKDRHYILQFVGSKISISKYQFRI